MKLLYEELGLNDKRLQEIVCRTAVDILMMSHSRDSSVEMITGAERQKLNDEFKEGLQFLQENTILKFSEDAYLYRVIILNEYKLNKIISELMWLETYKEGASDSQPPEINDTAHYERSSGDIIINGTIKRLKGKNKRLFDTLFTASPRHATRSALLRAIGRKQSESTDDTIALNEAFSNLRKACGVGSEVISLSRDGGKLNAKITQLVEPDEIYLSNFLTP